MQHVFKRHDFFGIFRKQTLSGHNVSFSCIRLQEKVNATVTVWMERWHVIMRKLSRMAGCFADKICLTLVTENATVTAWIERWHVIMRNFCEMAGCFADKICPTLEFHDLWQVKFWILVTLFRSCCQILEPDRWHKSLSFLRNFQRRMQSLITQLQKM